MYVDQVQFLERVIIIASCPPPPCADLHSAGVSPNLFVPSPTRIMRGVGIPGREEREGQREREMLQSSYLEDEGRNTAMYVG